MKEQQVSHQDFIAWKHDPVTKFIHALLKDALEHTLSRMVSKDIISSPEGHLRLNELRGYASAIEDVLDLNPVEEEDVVEPREEEDNESESSRI